MVHLWFDDKGIASVSPHSCNSFMKRMKRLLIIYLRKRKITLKTKVKTTTARCAL